MARRGGRSVDPDRPGSCREHGGDQPGLLRRVEPEHLDVLERLSHRLCQEPADPRRVAGDLEHLERHGGPRRGRVMVAVGEPVDEVRQLWVLGDVVEADLAPPQVEAVGAAAVAVDCADGPGVARPPPCPAPAMPR